MNPAKRKKLYRLELNKISAETNTVKEQLVVKEEKVIQKEEVSVQLKPAEPIDVATDLKPADTVESLDNKKDKKKKLASQDA